MRSWMIIVALSLTLAGCSDDTKQPPPADRGTPREVSVAKEASTPKEAGAPKEAGKPQEASVAKEGGTKDGSTAPWTCKQIGECQKTCKIDTTCLSNCNTKGCTSAQTTMTALTDCAIKNCIIDCLGGFDAKCDACASAAGKCKTEYDACQNHKC